MDLNISGKFEYETKQKEGKDWKMMLGDSCEELITIDDNSIGLSVFSPPFSSLYTYSATERDLGNSKTEEDFNEHFKIIARELLRVTMNGRNCALHCAQIPAMLSRDGYIGMKDFRGDVIRIFIESGWIFHGEVCIDKDPQVQAIRTNAKALMFNQLKKDASWLRPALADYILLFRKPGDNEAPIKPDVSNEEWITWAHPVWYDIKESDVLQYRLARGDKDERHICPLQLGVIERCIKLWSNEGETVLSPFAGIGSEGFQALKFNRMFVGIELKPEYFKIACENLKFAEHQLNVNELF